MDNSANNEQTPNLVEAKSSPVKSSENSSEVKNSPFIETSENNSEVKTCPVIDTSENDSEVKISPVEASENNSEIKNSPEDSTEDKIEEDTIESFQEIDLSAIEIASGVLEEMEKSLDPNDAYENLMGACSSTAQALKQTISDVLRSRENIVITDVTNDLEENLSQKIADFENVVSGCFVAKDIKTDLTNIKHPAFSNVIITEVDESSEEVTSTNAQTITEVEEKKSSRDSNSPELNIESKNSSNKDVSEVNSKKDNVKEVKSTQIPQVQTESVPVLCSVGEDKSSKKQQKSNSNKKKGEKTVDQILKSLSNCSSTEEKLQTLCKRHVEVLEELRLLEPRMKQLERQVQSQLKEKEQLQADHNRMILAKSRLESLCRELQRQNKCIKEENLLRIKEEEEKRKEIANKFQSTLTDISTLMQEHSKKNIQLREENAELAKKLKALVDHYDTWEKHMEKIVQQNHLEAQLAKAKHAKVNLLLKQETEKFLREKQSLLENMSELQKKCTLLTSNELKLRTELGDYTSKYEEFQTVLNKSSQVFSSFKNDMEATSKKIKKLEKETNVYKQKWESSNNALLGMINDKQKHDKELSNAHQRVSTLEKLCRALQAERNELQNQLNAVSGSMNSSTKDVPPPPSAETQVA